MSIRKRSVRVYEVPEYMVATQERSFLSDLQKYAESERPRVVLDCCRVRDMDFATIRLLLSCLEIVMKCNGDVRLASLRPEAALQLVGVNRLFEKYATAEGAVQSFHQRPTSIAPLESGSEALDRDSGHAA